MDGEWMANFASLHFSGRALKWHSDLPLDVRQDWFKLEKALLERWSPPEDEGDNQPENAIVPTPAAASFPPIQSKKKSETGVLEFVPMKGSSATSTYIAVPNLPGSTCRGTDTL
ncbi:hypothetical protein FRC01_000699, partial [Tulasnella sp. 417]